MRSHRKLTVLGVILIVLSMLLAGCGEGGKVGGEDILDIDEQKDAKRLGSLEDSPEPAETAGDKAALGQAKPSSAPPPPPPAEKKYFDVFLVPDSPYYEPGNELVMSVGHVLRVTNRDGTAERPTRTFTAEDGSFDSGPLAAGKTWEMEFGRGGYFRILDKSAPFIFATLEVR